MAAPPPKASQIPVLAGASPSQYPSLPSSPSLPNLESSSSSSTQAPGSPRPRAGPSPGAPASQVPQPISWSKVAKTATAGPSSVVVTNIPTASLPPPPKIKPADKSPYSRPPSNGSAAGSSVPSKGKGGRKSAVPGGAAHSAGPSGSRGGRGEAAPGAGNGHKKRASMSSMGGLGGAGGGRGPPSGGRMTGSASLNNLADVSKAKRKSLATPLPPAQSSLSPFAPAFEFAPTAPAFTPSAATLASLPTPSTTTESNQVANSTPSAPDEKTQTAFSAEPTVSTEWPALVAEEKPVEAADKPEVASEEQAQVIEQAQNEEDKAVVQVQETAVVEEEKPAQDAAAAQIQETANVELEKAEKDKGDAQVQETAEVGETAEVEKGKFEEVKAAAQVQETASAEEHKAIIQVEESEEAAEAEAQIATSPPNAEAAAPSQNEQVQEMAEQEEVTFAVEEKEELEEGEIVEPTIEEPATATQSLAQEQEEKAQADLSSKNLPASQELPTAEEPSEKAGAEEQTAIDEQIATDEQAAEQKLAPEEKLAAGPGTEVEASAPSVSPAEGDAVEAPLPEESAVTETTPEDAAEGASERVAESAIEVRESDAADSNGALPQSSSSIPDTLEATLPRLAEQAAAANEVQASTDATLEAATHSVSEVDMPVSAEEVAALPSIDEQLDVDEAGPVASSIPEQGVAADTVPVEEPVVLEGALAGNVEAAEVTREPDVASTAVVDAAAWTPFESIEEDVAEVETPRAVEEHGSRSTSPNAGAKSSTEDAALPENETVTDRKSTTEPVDRERSLTTTASELPSAPSSEPPSLTMAIISAWNTTSWAQRIPAVISSIAINAVLPFINGVMLGFGELWARNFITVRMGWASPLSGNASSTTRANTSSMGLGAAGSSRFSEGKTGSAAARTAAEAVVEEAENIV